MCVLSLAPLCICANAHCGERVRAPRGPLALPQTALDTTPHLYTFSPKYSSHTRTLSHRCDGPSLSGSRLGDGSRLCLSPLGIRIWCVHKAHRLA